MKAKKITALVVATGFLATAAFAEDQPAVPGTLPTVTSPAPAAPNQIVYAPQLPSIAELNKVAAAQGVTTNATSSENTMAAVAPIGIGRM